MNRLKTICDTDSSVENLSIESLIKCKTNLDFSDSDDEDNSKLTDKDLRCDKFINMTPRNRTKCKNNNRKLQNNFCDLDSNNVITKTLSSNLKDTKEKSASKEIDSHNRKIDSNFLEIFKQMFEDTTKTNNEIKNQKTSRNDKINLDDSSSPEQKLNNHLRETNKVKEENITSHINNTQKGTNKSKTAKQTNINGTDKRRTKNCNKKLLKHLDTSSNNDSDDDYLIIRQSATGCNMKQPKKISFLASLSGKYMRICRSEFLIYSGTPLTQIT